MNNIKDKNICFKVVRKKLEKNDGLFLLNELIFQKILKKNNRFFTEQKIYFLTVLCTDRTILFEQTFENELNDITKQSFSEKTNEIYENKR